MFGEQSIGVTGSIRSRVFVCLMVLLAILALTRIGDHFGFVAMMVSFDRDSFGVTS